MSSEAQEPQGPGSRGRQPILNVPGVVTALIAVMAAIHVASTYVFNEDAVFFVRDWFGFIPVRLIYAELIPGGVWPLAWTPFTHAFLHAGWEHILINACWLAIFGTPVARRYGAGPSLAVFLVSAAAGALFFAATTLPQVQILIGASGGVSGLTGAAVRFMFQPVVYGVDRSTGERVALGRRLVPLRGLLVEPKARFFTIVWVVLNAAVPLLPLLTGMDVQIAWQAHLGGFLAGLLLVGLFERRG